MTSAQDNMQWVRSKFLERFGLAEVIRIEEEARRMVRDLTVPYPRTYLGATTE
jgi:hypothetical protein